jgi:farnesyl-diphosphate farnesyltransferase
VEALTLKNQEQLPLNLEQDAYLKNQMKKVSRSFAVVVAPLEQPLRGLLSTAYLVCRIADNIEDCHQSNDWKDNRFGELQNLLTDPTIAPDILLDWEAESWPDLTPDEVMMMGLSAGEELWRIFANIPLTTRAIIQRWAATMVEGMRYLGDPGRDPLFIENQGFRVLSREKDYDEYCFIVAGTVGHMATELAINYYNLNSDVGRRIIETSDACGRALQKTNILKDFNKDLGRGICYLPDEWLKGAAYSPLSLAGAPVNWKRMVIENILGELRTATEYVISLPTHAEGYRQASLLCLLPALQTNMLAAKVQDRLFTSSHEYKISHLNLRKCMLDARRLARDNEQILAYSDKLQSEIKGILSSSKVSM